MLAAILLVVSLASIFAALAYHAWKLSAQRDKAREGERDNLLRAVRAERQHQLEKELHERTRREYATEIADLEAQNANLRKRLDRVLEAASG